MKYPAETSAVSVTLHSIMPNLGKLMHVENAPNRRGDGVVRNQFIIHYTRGEVFQSYETVCGAKCDGQLYLTDAHDYSATTNLYVGKWCGKGIDERRKGLKDGSIVRLVD